MKYNRSNKKIYFTKAPKTTNNLKSFKDKDIINALNRILEQSFSIAKAKDLIIHFFDKKAKKDISRKKFYDVFKTKNEFYEYFNIDKKDQKILNELFPEEYLTKIDNSSPDVDIKSLISVVANIKTESEININWDEISETI